MDLSIEQKSVLDECIDEFTAADEEARKQIVEKYFEKFEDLISGGQGLVMRTVSTPSAELNCSDGFLAYFPALVMENQAGRNEGAGSRISTIWISNP